MFILCIHRADNGESLSFVARSRSKLRMAVNVARAGGHAWRVYDTSPRGGWCDGSPGAHEEIPEIATMRATIVL